MSVRIDPSEPAHAICRQRRTRYPQLHLIEHYFASKYCKSYPPSIANLQYARTYDVQNTRRSYISIPPTGLPFLFSAVRSLFSQSKDSTIALEFQRHTRSN